MKKLLLTGLVGLGLVFSGCGGGSSTPTSTNVNGVPVASVTSLSLAVNEGASGSLDFANSFSDPDGDSLTYSLVMSNGSALPSGYSFAGSVLTVTVASNSIADLANVEHNLSVTASDGEANASVSVVTTLQDVANDSLMTFTTSIPSSVDSNGTLVGSVTLVDSDGLSGTNINYNIEDLNKPLALFSP